MVDGVGEIDVVRTGAERLFETDAVSMKEFVKLADEVRVSLGDSLIVFQSADALFVTESDSIAENDLDLLFPVAEVEGEAENVSSVSVAC